MAQDSGSKGPSVRHCVVSLSKTPLLSTGSTEENRK